MHFISSKLKNFDFHRKTKEEVNSQTVGGAFMTLLSLIIIPWLLFTNISNYLKTEKISRMIADNSVGVDAVNILFDIDFQEITCESNYLFNNYYIITIN